MVKSASTIDDDESKWQWKEFTSAKGRKYRVGVLKPANLKIVDGVEEDLLAPPKHTQHRLAGEENTITHTLYDVWWPVGDDSMKTPAQRIIDEVDIKKYCVAWNTGGWSDYFVKIENSQPWDYFFTDESGDTYTLRTYQTLTTHKVTYNSDQPTIVKIKATS